MWLKRLVGVVMIIVCFGMNALVIIGFFATDKTKTAFMPAAQTEQAPIVAPPSVTLTANPISISAGDYSAITWTSTNNPSSCLAADTWTGAKTPNGAESTGRLSTPGNYKYTISCKNTGGTGTVSVSVAVGPANSAPPNAPKGSSGTSTSVAAATYCGGRIPCYGPSAVSGHSGPGNCWGWLGDRVINVSSFDSGFHAARSGVANIQTGSICGKDLSPSVNGSVPSPEYPSGHAHQLGAKSSTDSNYLGYFVGYFDKSKP